MVREAFFYHPRVSYLLIDWGAIRPAPNGQDDGGRAGDDFFAGPHSAEMARTACALPYAFLLFESPRIFLPMMTFSISLLPSKISRTLALRQ